MGQEYKDSMSYVVTTVRRKGESPRTMTVDQPSDRDAKSYCAVLAAQYQRVTLHGMDEDGILSVVGRWQGGHAKRGAVPQGNLPRVSRVRPVEVIEGDVDVVSAVESLREAAEQYVEVTEGMEDEPSIQDEADSGETYEGYCVKCREKREFHGHVEETDSGRRMAKGTCPVCGTKMNRILKNVEHDEWDEDGHRQGGTGHGPVFSDGDVSKEDVKAAVVAAAEGVSAELVAEVAEELAQDIPEGVSEAEAAGEGQPEERPRAARRPPRPRKGDQAKAKEDNPVADLPVSECFKCGQQIPVQDKAGIRIMMQHSAPGQERCPGSLTVVQ